MRTQNAHEVRRQSAKEFPWLPDSLIDALEEIAQGRTVVPSLELDRQLHALCLNTRVFNRLNAIMFDKVGHGFMHRPCCGATPDEGIALQVKPLTAQENADYSEFFKQLLAIMHRLEDDVSPVNVREMPVGVYSDAEYQSSRMAGSVILS